MVDRITRLKEIFKRERAEVTRRREKSSDSSVESSEQLIDSFFGQEGDLNRVQLRSGSSYSSAPPLQRSLSDPQISVYGTAESAFSGYEIPLSAPMNNPPTYQNVGSGGGQGYIGPAPIRVIPTDISIRHFTGSDSDYTARQFLDLCEASIVHSSITEDHDKIAFVKSRLQPGSRALILMQSSAFAAADIGTSYDLFKKHFIMIFGGGSQQSVIRQAAHTVEAIQSKTSTKAIWDGMVEANQLAVDSIKSLKDAKWFQEGKISEEGLKRFLEIQFYLFHIPEKARKACLTLAFKPETKLVDFVSQLEIKLQERGSDSDVKSSVAAPIQARSRSLPRCYQCKQEGHFAAHCPSARGGVSTPSSSREGPVRNFENKDKSSQVQQERKPTQHKQTSFCHIHGTGSHTSANCWKLKSIRKQNAKQSTRTPTSHSDKSA